ncbi:aromatic-ring-hydroxylating dioxygenase subunit beta [Natrarchaeobius oligotrophus]|uniref:3-phenylpropionate/cinnamic acid dioxygenase subunit beta n=1 Tax=Natrarchaeobius chitinivorans TaxID=1679083 RepID=A0A3N6PGK8_NATCH|nr:3-phenylpropionate/cinnamic acid dioxygenase subunit beta [Natrarchaeobius chitinivorans]RQG99439.1 3-phenylpropionate/cinnamic acid dioxygenase subunit beta [Natrarchaeobius chitinivorans]
MSYVKPTQERRELLEEVRTFLAYEADLLDNRDLDEWLDLLTDDISYEVPRRITREAGDDVPVFSEKSFHLQEDIDSFEARIARYEKDYAWAENPPSRTRRFVTNVRIESVDGDEVRERNNMLLLRLRGEEAEPTFISGERVDTLRREDGYLKLADRRVLLDQTVMGTQNLSEFL